MSHKTPKSDEIARFLLLKQDLKLTWDELSAELGVPKRTMQHYAWNTGVLSGAVLRSAYEKFGVSIDWLLTGKGSMYAKDELSATDDSGIKDHHGTYHQGDHSDALIPFLEHLDLHQLQDYFTLTAATIEQSIIEAGANPGVDYTYLDLYRLAQPFVLEKFQDGGVEIAIFQLKDQRNK